RVPAAEVESLVAAAVRQHFAIEPTLDVRELVRTHVARVDITATTIRLTVNPSPRSATSNLAAPQEFGESEDRDLGSPNTDQQSDDPVVFSIPWTKRPAKRYREILIPNGGNRSDIRPLRPETRARLVNAIAPARLA